MTGQVVHGANASWESLDEYRKAAKTSLSCLSPIKSGPEGQLLTLLCVSRNEADILPAFLTHYREIGVRRFVIVDNDSSDNSAEILQSADDVELYWTDAKYADNNGGRYWLDGIAYEKYLNNWILVADADERLVYSDCFERPLSELIRVLMKKGYTKLFAPMVDLYPLEGDRLYFDKSHDLILHGEWGALVFGGPRYRMASRFNLETRPCLTKYPLLFYDKDTAFPHSHFPLPRSTNGSECFARMLHTKLGLRFSSKVKSAIEEGQHWQNAIEYRDYARWMTEDLRDETSSPYISPNDLISAELMTRVPWYAIDAPLTVDARLPSTSLINIVLSELAHERHAHAETRRMDQELRQQFEQVLQKLDGLRLSVDISSKAVQSLIENQPAITDIAREVWFERQRWGLPYKISKWLKTR